MNPHRNSTLMILPIVVVLLAGAVPFVSVAQSSSSLVELVPSGRTAPPVPTGKSPWAGGVTLATQFLGWLSDEALKASIDTKVKSLKREIDSAMPRSGGVLVVIGIQQSAQPDVNGRYLRSVLDGYVGGSGATAKATMDAYLANDRLEQGVPQGFVRRNIYFWQPSVAR